MGAQPERSVPLPSRGSDPLVSALQARAAQHAAQECADRDQPLAVTPECRSLRYAWNAPDGTEALMQVWYVPGEFPRIQAVELLAVNGLAPASDQKTHYESAFEAEMYDAGRTWQDVASYLDAR